MKDNIVTIELNKKNWNIVIEPMINNSKYELPILIKTMLWFIDMIKLTEGRIFFY